LTCILPPKADGVPTWKSDKIGEDFIIKLPNFLQPFIQEGQALSEDMGAAFARWAKGDEISRRATQENEASTDGAATGSVGRAEPAAVPAIDMAKLAEDDVTLGEAAKGGIEALRTAYLALPEEIRKHPVIKSAIERRHKPTAKAADEAHEPAS
jgi:hypothetical protein